MAHSKEILRVRAKFLMVARELEEKRGAKLQELSNLQTAEFIEEGLSEVVEIINVAWQHSAVVDDLLKAAKDADAYRSAVEAFLANVDKSKKAVEDGREKLEKARRERAERQRLYSVLSEWKGQLADALGSLTETEIVSDPTQVLGKFYGRLRELMSEAVSLWAAGGGERQLAEWRTDVEAWAELVESTLGEFGTHRDNVLLERKAKFASRIALFGKSQESVRGGSPMKVSPVKQQLGLSVGRNSAAAKITSEGMSEYNEKLMQISSMVEDLHRSGADRGGVQSCLNHFVTSAYRKSNTPPRGSTPRGTGGTSPRGNTTPRGRGNTSAT